MNQILICSDIVSYFFTENYLELEKCGVQLINTNRSFVVEKCPSEGFSALKNKLAEEIDRFLFGRQENLGRVSEVNYLGRTLRLDIRNKSDWQIALLVGLFNLFDDAIKMNGSVFIFNREKFLQNWASEILACLRGNRLSVYEIMEKVRQGWIDAGFEKKIILKDIEAGLSFLQENGLIFFWEKERLYEITARGHLFR